MVKLILVLWLGLMGGPGSSKQIETFSPECYAAIGNLSGEEMTRLYGLGFRLAKLNEPALDLSVPFLLAHPEACLVDLIVHVSK